MSRICVCRACYRSASAQELCISNGIPHVKWMKARGRAMQRLSEWNFLCPLWLSLWIFLCLLPHDLLSVPWMLYAFVLSDGSDMLKEAWKSLAHCFLCSRLRRYQPLSHCFATLPPLPPLSALELLGLPFALRTWEFCEGHSLLNALLSL